MFDAPAALIAWRMDALMGGKSQVTDYLPFKKEISETVADEPREITMDDVLKAFGGGKRR